MKGFLFTMNLLINEFDIVFIYLTLIKINIMKNISILITSIGGPPGKSAYGSLKIEGLENYILATQT